MFDVTDFGPLFSLLRERFSQQQSTLNLLDSAVGDGDHGFTMTRAMQAAESAAQGSFQDLGKGFDAVAEAIAENAGGAIGPLLAGLFAEGGLVLSDHQQLDLASFVSFLTGGLQAVKEIGLAEPGEKTLVDALTPAVSIFDQNSYPSLSEGVLAAARAAQQGAERTRDMAAVRGRARFTSERSLGHQDAGATSLALLLQIIHDYLAGERAQAPFEEKEVSFSPPPGKLINNPDLIIEQDNQGLARLHPELIKLTPDGILLRAKPKDSGKVALVIGHGGGHTPSMGGFIGPGLLDADVYGPIFTCASGVSIAGAVEKADRGGGIVLLVSNHTGDVLNARLAIRRARAKGIEVVPVILSDDIATAPRDQYLERRGLGGLLFALKIGGGAAESGAALPEVVSLMKKTNQRTATLSVAVSPPTHPVTGKPLFEMPPGQIEIGTGVHGEVGVYQGPHLPADKIIELLLDRIVEDLDPFDTSQVLAFINGAGGTSQMELNILYNSTHQQLTERGIQVSAGVADSFFTTLEMGGFSLSLCAPDQEMLSYWSHPAQSPSFQWPKN